MLMVVPTKQRGRSLAQAIFSIVGLVLSLGAITILVRLSGTNSVAVHLLYLPIVYGAFMFGDYGAILVALVSAVACGVWTASGFTELGEPVEQALRDIVVRAAIFYVVAIVTSRAFTELRRRVTEQRTLFQVASSISSSLRIREVLEHIAQASLLVFDAKGCGIRLLDPASGELTLAATAGLSEEYWEKGPVRASEMDEAVSRGLVEQIYDAPTDWRFRYQEEARQAGVTSLLTVPLHTKDTVIGRMRVYARRRHRFRRREVELLNAVADQAAVAIENAQLYEDIRRNYYETVRALTRAIEAKDLATFSHSERVTELADQMAQDLGWSLDQREVLRFGAILHDVGKIGVAEQSMEARTQGDPERIFFEMHPLIGNSILQPIGFLEPILPVVRYHHECWDGTGFPEGLRGKDIPEMARMVAVADVYDRLRYPADGNGQPGLSAREALERITAEAGSRFDPDLVRIFRRVITRRIGNPGEEELAELDPPAAPPPAPAEDVQS